MEKFFNTLFFDGSSVDTDHILRIVDSCRPEDPFDFIRVLSVQDDGLYFLTKSRSPAEAIATRASLECPNTEFELNLEYSGYDTFYVHSIYYNGLVTLEVYCCLCFFSIRVPPCLGYDGDMFVSHGCIPETNLIARDDVTAMANIVLKMAIENAPSKEGADMMLKDSKMYDAALETAEDSLTRLYDELSFPAITLKDNSPSTTSSSDTEPAETNNDNDDIDFPFSLVRRK